MKGYLHSVTCHLTTEVSHLVDKMPIFLLNCCSCAVLERVETFKYLGVNIHEELKWEVHTSVVVSKAQQRLYGLRRLKKFGLSPHTIKAFYNREPVNKQLHQLVWELYRSGP